MFQLPCKWQCYIFHKWRNMSEYYKILMWRCHNLLQLLSLWPWQPSRTQTKLGTCLGWLSKTYLWERFDSFWMNPQIISFCLIDQSFNVLYWYPRLIVMKLVVWQHQARPQLKFTRRQLRLLNLYRKSHQKYKRSGKLGFYLGEGCVHFICKIQFDTTLRSRGPKD